MCREAPPELVGDTFKFYKALINRGVKLYQLSKMFSKWICEIEN